MDDDVVSDLRTFEKKRLAFLCTPSTSTVAT
jgi:hypothetical protein